MKTIKLNPLNLRLPEITSASSLLNVDGRIFSCCDDQYTLYELINDKTWVSHHWSDAPNLPSLPHERKKLKPDFEALLGPVEDNLILLIPSGSKINRTMALKFNLITNRFLPFDMSNFFRELSKYVTEINIEGIAVHDGNYLFLNRGVQANPSTIISVNSKSFKINSVTRIDFGLIGETPLHGSELCIFENKLYALAVGEATTNSYDDGEILGSVLVRISLENLVIQDRWIFDQQIKAEGLCRSLDHWLVATDPDGGGHSEFYQFSL